MSICQFATFIGGGAATGTVKTVLGGGGGGGPSTCLKNSHKNPLSVNSPHLAIAMSAAGDGVAGSGVLLTRLFRSVRCVGHSSGCTGWKGGAAA